VDEAIFSKLRAPLSTAQEIFIFLPPEPSFDQVASSLALFLSLKKSGKQLSLICPTPMRVGYSDLVGIDQIRTKLAGRNLMVSFDYLEDSIEKVSYHIEENKFNLVIQPKVGFPPLSSEKVSYSYSGGQADLIFTFGVRDLERLRSLYQDSKTLFKQEKIVDIDLVPKSKRFAQIEIILTASSFSEIVACLTSQLRLPIDQDSATNLLMGMQKATHSFSSSQTTAATFEAAAFCLRAGAKRSFIRPRSVSKKRSIPLEPMPTTVSARKKPEKILIQEEEKEKKPSPDWLEPKIYKGNAKI